MHAGLFERRHKGRLLLLLFVLFGTLTYFGFFHKWTKFSARILSDDEYSATLSSSAAVADSDMMSDYQKGWLEPEWEWARDVSIVYTWVNGSDPIHLAQKAAVTGQIAHEDKRDRTFDELRYSIRSVLEHMPWHRGKIFIVTPGQTPTWLRKDQDKIVVVDQATILPKEVGTTFNSFLIEFFLDKVPDIHDYMIQLNDDYFFSRYAHPRFFFTMDGRLRFFRTNNLWNINRQKANQELEKLTPHSSWDEKLLQALRHTGASIKEIFNDDSVSFYWLEHAPYVWTKWSFAAVRMAFHDRLLEMYSHKFRNQADLVPTIAHQAYIDRLADGDMSFAVNEQNGAERSLYRFGQLLDNPKVNTKMFELFRTRKYVMFNINDDLTPLADNEPAKQFSAFLNQMFPKKSFVELK